MSGMHRMSAISVKITKTVKSTKPSAVIAAAVALLAFTTGCRIDANRGDNKDVKIATPFGNMQVKTNAAATDGIGLPAYPGSVILKKHGDNDGAADVNMSFGSFQLRVKAASYSTTDSPDKVSAFYRKALATFGDVIQCQDNKPVGMPTRTGQGLTCDDDKGTHYTTGTTGEKTELKAGSKQHQHIVAIDPDGSGTKIGLVALDLPGHITVDGDNNDDEHKQ